MHVRVIGDSDPRTEKPSCLSVWPCDGLATCPWSTKSLSQQHLGWAPALHTPLLELDGASLENRWMDDIYVVVRIEKSVCVMH